MFDLRAHKETILLDFFLRVRKLVVVVVVVVVVVLFVVFVVLIFLFLGFSVRAVVVFLLFQSLLFYLHVKIYSRRVLHRLQHLRKRTLPIFFDALLKHAGKHCPPSRLCERRGVLRARLAEFIPRSRRDQPNRIRPAAFHFVVRYAPIENVHQFQRVRWPQLRL